MKEIGSEFWSINLLDYENNLDYLNIGKDNKLLMSGRTAIDYVLNEINDTKKIVYMPNYCCESMIQPFIDNNYIIKYYDIDIINNKYNIDCDIDCSIFFAMSYFGYNESNMDTYIERFNQRNIIVIEDITHRLLSKKNHCNKSTYLIGSLRKWFPIITGGIAVNLISKFKNTTYDYKFNSEFIELKIKAMNLKKAYIENKINDKSEYLALFNETNCMIENYQNMQIDNISINILKHLDINEIKNKRINNCKLIENKLINNKNIKLLYKYNDGDCPLFVPILLENRDSIREELIKNNIYCPVHWPNFNDFNNKIYNKELSLICDQRYSSDDVINYIDKLINIVGD